MNEKEALPLSELIAHITSHIDGVDVVTYPPDAQTTAWFFSLDADEHWPNFATVVTTDEHDMEDNSNLAARAAYRLNIGIGRESFERLIDPSRNYDYTATDTVLPHPTYAKQRWIGVVNPSRQTFEAQLKPLLTEAAARVTKTT